MKVEKVNNYGYAKRTQVQEAQKAQSPAFKGVGASVSDGVVGIFNAMDRGGFAASFIFADTLSTNLPRTWQATERGREITGKRNWKAAGEVILREFITGPSMFAVPALVLAAGAKLSGKANHVSVESIQGFSDILRNTKQTGNLKENFYKSAFNTIAENSFGRKLSAQETKEYVDLLLSSEKKGVPVRGPIRMLLDKKHPKGKAVDQIISDLAEKFIKDKKANVNYRCDFTTAKISGYGSETSFKKVVKDMQNFINDASNYVAKQAPDEHFHNVVEKFRNVRTASRFITAPLALLATAAFLSIVPKIYSFNAKNPETEALYDKIGQERKVATNATK